MCTFVLPPNTLKTCLHYMLCGYKKENGEPSGSLGSWNQKRNRWLLKMILLSNRTPSVWILPPNAELFKTTNIFTRNFASPLTFLRFSQLHSFRDADVSPVRYRLGQLGSPLPSWFLYRSKAKNALPCVWFVYWHSNSKSSQNILRSLKRRNFRE